MATAVEAIRRCNCGIYPCDSTSHFICV